MGLEPGAHQHLDLPREMTRPDRAAAEVAARRDAHAGFLCGAYRAERLVEKGDTRRLGVGESTAIGRGEADEAIEHAECRHERRVPGHLRRRGGVDAESVLDRVDARLYCDRGAFPLRVRGDRFPRSWTAPTVGLSSSAVNVTSSPLRPVPT